MVVLVDVGQSWELILLSPCRQHLQAKPLDYLVPKLLHHPAWMYAILALLHHSEMSKRED